MLAKYVNMWIDDNCNIGVKVNERLCITNNITISDIDFDPGDLKSQDND